MSLEQIFATLVRYEIARSSAPSPAPEPGITWRWSATGIYKRGVSPTRDLQICVGDTPPVPGLADLAPHVRFRLLAGPIANSLLEALLLHARCVGHTEQQYFIVWANDRFELLIPAQEATASRVRYTMPDTPVLVDIHSHHTMPAYFSATDDRDDQGLTVSMVIGRLETPRPEAILRANVYGHRQILPLTAVFASSAPFHEREGT